MNRPNCSPVSLLSIILRGIAARAREEFRSGLHRHSAGLCLLVSLEICLASATSALASPGVTVLSNLGAASPHGTKISAFIDGGDNGVTYFAQSFTTGTSDLTLGVVTLNLGASVGITASSKPLVVSIYSNAVGTTYYNQTGPPYSMSPNTGEPGSVLPSGTLTAATANPTTAGNYTYTGSVTLSANTTYWIVATSADTAGYYVWNYASTDTGTTSFTTAGGWSVSPTFTASQQIDDQPGPPEYVENGFWSTYPGLPQICSIAPAPPASTRISGAIPANTIENANQGVAILSNGGHADLYLHQFTGDQVTFTPTGPEYAAMVVVYDSTNTVVNTITANESAAGETPLAAGIAALANGGFVVVWTSQDDQGNTTFPAYYETFTNGGLPADVSGSRHHALSTSANTGGYGIQVTGLPNGSFAAVYNSGSIDIVDTFSYGGTLTSFTRVNESQIGSSSFNVTLPGEGSNNRLTVVGSNPCMLAFSNSSFIVEEGTYVENSGIADYTPLGDFLYKYSSTGLPMNFASGYPEQRVNWNYSQGSSFGLALLPGGGFATLNKDGVLFAPNPAGFFELTLFNADGSLITSSTTNTQSVVIPENSANVTKNYVATRIAPLDNSLPNAEGSPDFTYNALTVTGGNLVVALTNTTGGFNIGTYSTTDGSVVSALADSGLTSVGGGFALANPRLVPQTGGLWGITYDDYYFNGTTGYETASVYQAGFVATVASVTATQNIASESLTQSHLATPFTPVTGSGGTAPLTYSISPPLPSGLSMSSGNGQISGTPSVTHASSSFTVTVTDANSNTATNSFNLTINTAVSAAQSIATKNMTQNQASATFTPVTGAGGTGSLGYTISPPLPAGLSISGSNGAIIGTPTVTLSATSFTVTVTDTNGASASNSFTLSANAPTTATQAIGSVSLTQNRLANPFIPVTGAAGTAPLTYGVSPPLPTGLSLSAGNGQITGTPSVSSPTATYTVTVTDANNEAASNTFNLTVNGPVTATQSIASKTLTQLQPSANFTPVTGNGGTGALSYSISPPLPANLSISSTNGAITGSPSVTLSATTFTVTVTDTNNATSSQTFSLTVNTQVTTTLAQPTAILTQNQTGSLMPVQGFGGTGALTYSVSPPLPTNLSIMSTNGQISGIPAATHAASNFIITVTDTNGATASNTFSLTVNGPVTATQAVTSTALTLNQAVTPFTPVTESGGTAPFGYAVTPPLPTGLSLDSSSGTITGTPTVTHASSSFTVTIVDFWGGTASNTFSLTVNSAVSATQAVASTSLTQNNLAAPFIPVTGAGGTGSLTYSVSPPLPTGLSISASNGQITGTPTVTHSTSSFTVTVADTNSATATNTFSLTINQPPTLSPSVLPSGTAGSAYNQTITASSGTGTLGLVVSNITNAVAGLNVPSSGTGSLSINGTPTGAGTESFTLTVTDSVGATSFTNYSILVNPGVATQLVVTAPGTANAGTAVPVTVKALDANNNTATGYAGTVTFTSTDGAATLPAGSTLTSGTGNFNVTFQTVGSFTITATDIANSGLAGTSAPATTVSDSVGVSATSPAVVGGTNGAFTFARGGDGGAMTVNFRLDGASTADTSAYTLSGTGVSYSNGTGTVVIPNGSTSATVTLTAANTNGIARPNQTVQLDVTSGGSSYNIGSPANATVTITQNGFVVFNVNDSGEGTLRQAVANANALLGNPTITFDPTAFASPQSIMLTTGALQPTQAMTIKGSGANLLTVNGNNTDRVFLISGTSSKVISGLTITNGHAIGSGNAGGGGAIFNLSNSSLTLNSCAITASLADTFGGGILNFGNLAVLNSTVSGNTANSTGSGGGGIQNAGLLTVVNSTVSGNSVPSAGGGGLESGHTAFVVNSTIIGNLAGNSAGGISSANFSVTLWNTIVAGNQNNSTVPDVGGASTFTSLGNNLIGNPGTVTTFTNGVNGDQVGTSLLPLDPVVGPLAGNGGPTQTQALLDNSPAINAGATVPSAQMVMANGTEGNFKLTFNGQSTSNLSVNASASQVQTALTTLSTIGAGGVTVTGQSGAFIVTFQGTLASNTLPLTGTGSGVSVLVAAVGPQPYDQRGVGFPRVQGPAIDIGAYEALNYTPTVTNASTTEDTLTSSGLVITANSADGGGTQGYQITGITNGTLYQNDGSTPVANNSFITVAQGSAGLKFLPGTNLNSYLSTFGISVQASTTGDATGLVGSVVPVSITVTPVADTPSVTDSATNENTQTTSGLVLTPSPVDGAETTVFEITNIQNGTVYLNPSDGGAAITPGEFITVAEGGHGLRFTPTTGFLGQGTFLVQAANDNTGAGSSPTVQATINVGTANPTAAQVGTSATLNRQSGLYQLTVTVTNTTAFPLTYGFRLFVDYSAYLSTYPTLRLYNSTSGPGDTPVYVDYPYFVDTHSVVTLTLDFYTSNRLMPSPFSPVLTVQALKTAQNPIQNESGTPVTNIHKLADKTILLEWTSIAGHWYKVSYSSDMKTWFDSPTPLQAGSNQMQWIDSGPPFTSISPADPSVTSRFYIVNEIATP